MLTLDQQHRYWVEGKPIPGVTQMLGDLKITPPYPPGSYAQLGTRVHKLTELHDHDRLDYDLWCKQDEREDVNLRLRPYLDAYRQFLVDTKAEILYIEQRLFSQKYWFAGTLDRIIQINGKTGILDLKKTTSVARSTELQTAGYEVLALEAKERGEITLPTSDLRRWALALKTTGKYQLIEYTSPNDRPAFLGAVNLWRWQQRI